MSTLYFCNPLVDLLILGMFYNIFHIIFDVRVTDRLEVTFNSMKESGLQRRVLNLKKSKNYRVSNLTKNLIDKWR